MTCALEFLFKALIIPPLQGMGITDRFLVPQALMFKLYG